ncbi:zinc finger C2HC domain-containing protein 1C-like isoform X2 [Leptopilina heterotoma]|uniref:zinc finger C2HC domain-containing protein 1C-like isoform X2 n=1 Tax=Leptopilina heterotoma TaxID=63436 RepID=UPI001CAA0A05|nr:zinc finger C2HC domain-containing protein 1C-like isoform X2 [Leptopilina heterotoma]
MPPNNPFHKMSKRIPVRYNKITKARFQQKQLQEKEQKLLQLYDQQQQRAHQVAQRGSAGSNTSNQGSNMNHQTVTKTTATTRKSSTSQGGKVRQMFDERRQTTVKGIDRSYPLEPLDNKSKKQTTNGLTPGKNRNFSKHTVTTVKRTARADVNSNINDGKPVVSYHEEFSHENFGDNIHDDEFINENDVSRFINGNGQNRNELFDEEERNRAMGKIHMIDFDKNFHHRVVNDLESEQFPEDLMMEMSDKVGKKPLNKKLSQAELRLERFKNSSSKKNIASKSITKKRSDLNSTTQTTGRNARSLSPDFDERKQVENSKTTARRNNGGSPLKSPDNGLRQASVDLKTTRRPVIHSPKKEQKLDSSKDEIDSPNLENSQMEPKQETGSTNVKKMCENFIVDFNDSETKKVAKKPILRNEKSVTSQKESSPNPVPRPSSSLSASSGGSSKDKMNSKYKSSTSRGSTPRSSASMGSKTDYADNLVSCKNCSRRFTTDRIELHEKICAKSGQKKRKQFDAMKFRLQGTELEPFAKVGVKKQETKQKKTTVKSNWRKTHEDFISTIRSAKQVQAHLAAGGKLSDLPPPPPSDTSDYIQCPHCGRKFNESAAERHIPKCENMRHNKPNPRAPPKPRR